MARILVASVPSGVEVMERLLGSEHNLVIATTMGDAIAKLKEEDLDLIMIGVHFDESRMFDLMRECRAIQRNLMTPIISFCTRDTPLTRTMHDSIEVSARALGAWLYIDQHDYNVKRNPDAEVRRVIERCLVSTERIKNKEKRVSIQHRREELLRLRLALDCDEWSGNLEDRVAKLKQKLSEVLLDLSATLVQSVALQEKLAESTDREDRVSPDVKSQENAIARDERGIMLEESQQLANEQQLVPKEEERAKKLRQRSSMPAEIRTAESSSIIQKFGGIRPTE